MSINFPLLLVIAVAVCGVLALLDLVLLAPRRRTAIATYQGQVGEPDPAVLEKLGKEPLLVEYGKSFFPVLAIVLVLRSFLVEPFQIPSGSMKPTLEVGDFILVNKFAYGIRLPVLDTKVIEVGDPQRGDVMVFRYPSDPNVNYIKRVIGLPGDTIEYAGHTLTINGKVLDYVAAGEFMGTGRNAEMNGAARLTEKFPGHEHQVLELPDQFADPRGEGTWVVPAGHYLVMGDNRDRSDDGRFWGFLSEDRLRGKAFLVWLNCSGWFCSDGFDASRIGNGIP